MARRDPGTGKGFVQFALLKRGLGLMTRAERLFAAGIVALMMIAGLLESIVVALVIPLVYVIVDPTAFAKLRVGSLLATMTGGRTVSELFPYLAGILIVMLILSGSVNAVATWSSEKHAAVCRDRLSSELLTRCISAPYLWLLKFKTAVLTRHLYEDVRSWRKEFVHSVLMIVQSAIMIISPAAVALALAPSGGLMALALVAAVCALVVMIFRRRIRSISAATRIVSDRLSQTLFQILVGLREIKVSARESYFVGLFNKYHAESNELGVRARLVGQAPASLISILGQIGFLATALVLWYSGLPASEITAQLALIGVVVSRVVPAFNRLAGQVSILFRAAPFVDSLVRFRDELYRVTARSEGESREVPSDWQTLSLNDVTFSYPDSEISSLHAVSLTLERGKFYGFVGRSGAGKSTLVNLLLGLIEPSHGTVTVNEVPLQQFSLKNWHRNFGYVPQDTFLIDATVRENITFGEPADDSRVMQALGQMRLGGLSSGNGDLLDLQLGERGRRFSGGQGQRIAIARALFKRPSVLLLDEATSALDSVTEGEILSTVHELRGGTLGLMIAHRVSTLRNCDRIFVLDAGRIVESGAFDELMRASERFRSLAAAPDQV